MKVCFFREHVPQFVAFAIVSGVVHQWNIGACTALATLTPIA